MTAALTGAAAVFSPALMAQDATDDPFGVEQSDEILFEADDVFRESDTSPIVAEGDVRAFFGERYLRADRLTYDPATDVVTAEGNVSITDEDLETIFAGRVVISGDLRDGIAENFSALLEDNARLAADSAIQEQGARTKLNRAVYTACNVCDKKGDAKIPTWRIKSLRVTRDAERKVVRFHHAFFELKGVPILYTPFLQGPDPSVERQSGFLTPRVGASTRLGFNFELPYYFALSNSEDATFHPKYTAEDGVLWQAEYRRRFKNGYHVFQGGIIDGPNQPEPDPPTPGRLPVESTPGVRWHLFGRGYQDFGDHWRASYDIEHVSDIEYLRQYDVQRRGDLRQQVDRGATRQLRSNFRLARTGESSRLFIDTFLFQGLREQDDSSTTPYVLPLIDYEHRFGKLAGGDTSVTRQYRLDLSHRRHRLSAFHSRRELGPGHHHHRRTPHQFLFAQARGDIFFFQDLNEGTEICSDSFGGLRG